MIALTDGRPAFAWSGPAADREEAVAAAFRGFRMACRAIAFARGGDPDSAFVPEAAPDPEVSFGIASRKTDWTVMRAMLEAIPGKPRKRLLTQAGIKKVLLAAFAATTHRMMASGSFSGASIGFTVGHSSLRRAAFRLAPLGLAMEGSHMPRPGLHPRDPRDGEACLALACAYAAQNETPRSSLREVKVTVDRPGPATLRAAACALRTDPASVAARELLSRVSGASWSTCP